MMTPTTPPPDPLRTQLAALLTPVPVDDEAILNRVKVVLQAKPVKLEPPLNIEWLVNYHRANRTWEREGREIPF